MEKHGRAHIRMKKTDRRDAYLQLHATVKEFKYQASGGSRTLRQRAIMFLAPSSADLIPPEWPISSLQTSATKSKRLKCWRSSTTSSQSTIRLNAQQKRPLQQKQTTRIGVDIQVAIELPGPKRQRSYEPFPTSRQAKR